MSSRTDSWQLINPSASFCIHLLHPPPTTPHPLKDQFISNSSPLRPSIPSPWLPSLAPLAPPVWPPAASPTLVCVAPTAAAQAIGIELCPLIKQPLTIISQPASPSRAPSSLPAAPSATTPPATSSRSVASSPSPLPPPWSPPLRSRAVSYTHL